MSNNTDRSKTHREDKEAKILKPQPYQGWKLFYFLIKYSMVRLKTANWRNVNIPIELCCAVPDKFRKSRKSNLQKKI